MTVLANVCGTVDIGDNLTKVLVGIGVTLGPTLAGISALIFRRLHAEVRTVAADTAATKVATEATAVTVEATATTVDHIAQTNSGSVPVIAPTDIRDRPLGG